MKFLKLSLVFVICIVLIGCANMTNREQRVVSSIAVGGTIAGPVGAGIGAGIGLLIDVIKEK